MARKCIIFRAIFRLFCIILGLVCLLKFTRDPFLSGISSSEQNIISTSLESDSENDIFFVEASGERCLSAYQACSVETASKMNPKRNVLIYMDEKEPLDTSNDALVRRSCWITNAIMLNRTNTRIVREDLFKHYLKGTPLEKLVNRIQLKGTQLLIQHKSDIIRVALLWQRGGIYLDHDIVVLRPLTGLHNTIGMSNGAVWGNVFVENGVMSFQAGHPLLYYLMEKMAKEYDSGSYLSLGADSLAQSVVDFCDMEEIGDLPDQNVGGTFLCKNNSFIRIEPYDSFYAFDNKASDAFFQETFVEEKVRRTLKRSFLSHIYGARQHLRTPKGSLYNWLARQSCPMVYSMSLQEFGGF